ncbi:hypothetical protein [Colwellia sp. MB3u-55]|jgi:hypothetical protein|uniref:hypothetical protein n=1 Tax=Colwellia sp. MB3u-55 TaxID=2759810 RepID=UPI0015F644AE|nr:hypothetical protein [Colwellia sp. MB3u-55]MBA6252865.1 hypothetical protein [Colwellia sp. MB3u-55]
MINILKILLVTMIVMIGWTVLTDKYNSFKNKPTYSKNNYDGTYNIDYGNIKCGRLGYQFKKKYEYAFDDMQDAGPIRKSNCKNVDGFYQGYIYPSNHVWNLIPWQELKGGKVDKLPRSEM